MIPIVISVNYPVFCLDFSLSPYRIHLEQHIVQSQRVLFLFHCQSEWTISYFRFSNEFLDAIASLAMSHDKIIDKITLYWKMSTQLLANNLFGCCWALTPIVK